MSDLLDPGTSQVVRANRRLTRCEWDNVLGWARKATTPVRLFTQCRPEALGELNSGDEGLGPAWGTDLISLVLRTVWAMGNNGERLVMHYPIRIPANHASWSSEEDDTSAYILVCMAAVVAFDPRNFVVKKGELTNRGVTYTWDDLRKLCSPSFGGCVHKGMLWVYTGIFL
ncbi:hypothetical protein ANO14919_089960 [Xylariales sp. No.14919]|nr:hypothetical protein ANO14919_089960 [Xylariales sp. No.14919]